MASAAIAAMIQHPASRMVPRRIQVLTAGEDQRIREGLAGLGTRPRHSRGPGRRKSDTWPGSLLAGSQGIRPMTALAIGFRVKEQSLTGVRPSAGATLVTRKGQLQ
jgi:hypothetical protein